METLAPPRKRLFELKSSAEFSSSEFSHSIKTWVNMASLLIKQVDTCDTILYYLSIYPPHQLPNSPLTDIFFFLPYSIH